MKESFTKFVTVGKLRRLLKDVPDSAKFYIDTDADFQEPELQIVNTPSNMTPFVAVRGR